MWQRGPHPTLNKDGGGLNTTTQHQNRPTIVRQKKLRYKNEEREREGVEYWWREEWSEGRHSTSSTMWQQGLAGSVLPYEAVTLPQRGSIRDWEQNHNVDVQ